MTSMTRLTDFAETGWKVTLTFLLSRGFNYPPDGSNVNSLKACKINRILSLTFYMLTRLTDFAETGWKVTMTFLLSRGFNSPPDGSNVNSLKACKINRILSLTFYMLTRLTDFAETGWKVTMTFLLSRGFNSPPDGSNVNSLKACKINRILSLTFYMLTRLTDFAETGWKVTMTFLLSRGFNSPPDGSNVNSLKACKINRILSGL